VLVLGSEEPTEIKVRFEWSRNIPIISLSKHCQRACTTLDLQTTVAVTPAIPSFTNTRITN
jgi:hypothetical protein